MTRALAVWTEFAALARKAASDDLSDIALMDLAHTRNEARRQVFPIDFQSGRSAAVAMDSLADAFSMSMPELRAVYGPALREAAIAVEFLLDQYQANQAALSRRITGERDD